MTLNRLMYLAHLEALVRQLWTGILHTSMESGIFKSIQVRNRLCELCDKSHFLLYCRYMMI